MVEMPVNLLATPDEPSSESIAKDPKPFYPSTLNPKPLNPTESQAYRRYKISIYNLSSTSKHGQSIMPLQILQPINSFQTLIQLLNVCLKIA